LQTENSPDFRLKFTQFHQTQWLKAIKSAGDYDSDYNSQSSLVANHKLITLQFKFDSHTFSPLKIASFSTNPYNNFQAANSKEYISLDKAAK
jgi:hypothetical protein